MGRGPACPIHPQSAMGNDTLATASAYPICEAQHLIQATSLVNKRYRFGSDAVSLALLSHESHRGDAQLLPDSFCISPHDHGDPSAYVLSCVCSV